jgi:hypothetical protein
LPPHIEIFKGIRSAYIAQPAIKRGLQLQLSEPLRAHAAVSKSLYFVATVLSVHAAMNVAGLIVQTAIVHTLIVTCWKSDREAMSSNKFIKFARIARLTGKSLRAPPAVYESR